MEDKRSIENLLIEGQTVQFHPEGKSMFPLFVSEEDYAIVEPVCNRSLRKLDVCVYRRDNGPLIIHRVMKVDGNRVLFVGDRQIKEEVVNKENVYGIMTEFVRRGKKISVKNLGYRLYSTIWMWFKPIRHVLFKIGHVLKVISYKFLRKEITHWN